MARVLPFSQSYPSYHQRAGAPTYFVEQIWNGFKALRAESTSDMEDNVNKLNKHLPHDIVYKFLKNLHNQTVFFTTKYHTIRIGNRWKVGDMFSPRVWSGKPYNSKQIILAPDIEVKKVWNIEIYSEGDDIIQIIQTDGFNKGELIEIEEVAANDGLSYADFVNWFPVKKGESIFAQIICWNQNIQY